jgi:hypothetical protein
MKTDLWIALALLASAMHWFVLWAWLAIDEVGIWDYRPDERLLSVLSAHSADSADHPQPLR